MQFWYFLIEGKKSDSIGAFANFYAFGEHLGDALDKVLELAPACGIDAPQLAEAAYLDQADDYTKNDDIILVGEQVLMNVHVHTYPIDPQEIAFLPPVGIVKSNSDQDEYDYELMREQFAAYALDEDGFYNLELVADKKRLADTFLSGMAWMPQVNKLGIHLHPTWEVDDKELMLSQTKLNTKLAQRFFDYYRNETIENGHIDCLVYCNEGLSKWVLTEHKTLCFRTKDIAIFNNFGNQLLTAGFSQTQALYSFAKGFRHWHYRPKNSSNRKALKELLKSEGFK